MAVKSKKRTAAIVCLVVLILAAIFSAGYFGIDYIRQDEKSSRAIRVISADSSQQIAEKIIEKTEIKDLSKLRNDQVSKYYGVPMDIIDVSVVYKSQSTTEADEIAVFKVSEKMNIDVVTQAIDGRLSECRSSYATLNDTESQKVENCLIESSGEYIILVICSDTLSAGEAIAEFYK